MYRYTDKYRHYMGRYDGYNDMDLHITYEMGSSRDEVKKEISMGEKTYSAIRSCYYGLFAASILVMTLMIVL